MTILISDQDIEFKAPKKVRLCPKCKVALGHRVRRGVLFKTLLNLLPVKRYYCYKCKQKKYVWTN